MYNDEVASANSASPGSANMTRRPFLIVLGAGAVGVLSGYFLLDGTSKPPLKTDHVSTETVKPRLKTGMVFGRESDMLTLRASGAQDSPVCAVNATGEEIVRRLDGNHTISQVASELAHSKGQESTEALNADIACFVARIGELGFLQQPYYACIYETRTDSANA